MSFTYQQSQQLFRDEPQRFISVGSSQVAYRQVGNGPDVLFVHGWPANSATFRRLLPHLADHVTCHLIDLPGAGSSIFDGTSELSIANHIASVRAVVDELGLDNFAVIGHDSGGMIARHALAGDERVRAFGLINTEQPQGLNWRFNAFLSFRRVPAFGSILGWLLHQPKIRRNRFILGDAFADRSQLDGDFDEFILGPIKTSPAHRDATVALLKSFQVSHVEQLAELHRKIEVPVQLVWGAKDPFFTLDKAIDMVDTFPNAKIAVIEDGGLFVHEECAEQTARGLVPMLQNSQLVGAV